MFKQVQQLYTYNYKKLWNIADEDDDIQIQH